MFLETIVDYTPVHTVFIKGSTTKEQIVSSVLRSHCTKICAYIQADDLDLSETWPVHINMQSGLCFRSTLVRIYAVNVTFDRSSCDHVPAAVFTMDSVITSSEVCYPFCGEVFACHLVPGGIGYVQFQCLCPDSGCRDIVVSLGRTDFLVHGSVLFCQIVLTDTVY